MGKRTLAPGHKRYELKAGFQGFRWGGMYTEGDPSSIPPGKLRMLVNGRLYGGGVVNRPGLAEFNGTAFQSASAKVRFVGDFQISKPLKLWIQGDGCPGISSSAGFYIGCLDQEQSPEFQRVVYYSVLTTNVTIAEFDDALYIGTDDTLRRFQLITQPYGIEAIQVAGTGQDQIIKTFTGFTIRCMQAFDGKLFIGLDNGTGASKIASWDGLSIRDDVTTIDPPLAMGLYHAPSGGDTLVVGFGSGANCIKYRVTGDSPGTWATITPGAGTVAASSTSKMVAYKDKLYIPDGDVNVWAYDADAATLAIVRTPASGTHVRAVEVFNNLLYFGYETAASARIGKYDGSTWTDVDKNLTSQFSHARSIRSLASYRGVLVAGGTYDVGGGRLWISPGLTTSGTYLEVNPGSLLNGDISRLLVA